MPTLPWTTPEPPAAPSVLVMASRLEVRSLRHVPGFLLSSLALWRQARRSPGAHGVALKADLLHRTFWTLSAWKDEAAVRAYAATEPHKSVMRAKRRVMRESTFVFWTSPTTALPVDWAEARRRVEAQRAGEARQPDA
ncbi:uncharacterized protein DUF3291 [Actinocorallia herbida]|uniref:Uncharacterized protein DUF3291 n=1 Tax=Actinocorallia herbida TaxID=58109 RepID=A0A3N1CVG1_9ACTN|nr:DUF3291 domain-containing protein [Actinocorallia herbida]ROO85266.1 uncharacterized protein DUF3291 [Actinocorallia herbida]